MQKIAIIIPYYNEAKRIREDLVQALLKQEGTDVYLANDGSTDTTLLLLEDIAKRYSSNCFLVNYKKNQGKGGVIYATVNNVVLNKDYTHIGYFDADFSTPLSEIERIFGVQRNHPESFIIGSRILLLNSNLQRKLYRHIIGRTIATIVDTRFKLRIYDTQCGAKLFPAEIAREAFKQPFITKWLFDVEIFIRLKQKGLLGFGIELPLYNWKDVDGSKLNLTMVFKIVRELFLLNKYK